MNFSDIPYQIVRNNRSKLIKITATTEDGIVVHLPERYSVRDAEKFYKSQEDWILNQWERIEIERVKHADLFQPFLEKNSILYLGKPHQLVVDVGEKHWPPVLVEDGVIVVRCAMADLAENILERWYRKQAKAVISGAIEIYREKMGVEYQSLVIKDQKTRWGSCSSAGNLNFSWRLILAPKEVLDYVVVHELAHLREMNHSRDFWNLVATYYPNYKKPVKWLKENGVGLRI
jgi:predicted metal-dependent hydrolase